MSAPASSSKRYENFIVFLAPLINSVGGIAIDLFAPSIPAIGREFAVSAGTMQNSITVTLAFYAVGQIVFGLLTDGWGRRPSIVLGLILFLGGSLAAALAPSIEMLMVGRALQGFAIGACQVVSRALLVDNVGGARFRVAVVYLSLAYGLGPVVAPYVGGLVESTAGWRWNFGLYFVYGALVLAFVGVGLRESLEVSARQPLRACMKGYRSILSDRTFLAAVLLLGASFSTFLMWNVIGPFIVEERLGKDSAYFGSTALAVGSGYLLGTTLNRALLQRLAVAALMRCGLVLFGGGIGLIATGGPDLDLPTLLGGTVLIAFGQGFLFSNAMARTMSGFPRHAGSAASLQGCVMLSIGAAASGAVSAIPIESNVTVACMFAGLFAVALTGTCALLRSPGTAASAPAAR
ncbi:MAG: MFS transporter [Pseudomonadota bacterium]|nr:MFS transporter [Pseudomonadota bacterium]